MSLVVEDGTGLSTAESYISVTDADTYFSNLGNTTWSSATTSEKEIALRKATSYLDSTYEWNGIIYSKTQSLGFPRSYIYDSEGRDLKESVPVLIEKATCELALLSLSSDLLIDTTNANYIKKEKVGSLEVEYRDSAPVQKNYEYVDRLLKSLYINKSGSGNVRVIR